MATSPPAVKIIIVPGPSISEQQWWPQVHALVNGAYEFKDLSMFPPTWYRLNLDPIKGAKGLAAELGNEGHLAVAFDEAQQPIACGGMLPFRGEKWIQSAFEKKSDAEIANGARPATVLPSDWETCCWCVGPSARGQGLSRRILQEVIDFLKPRGAQRLYSNYVMAETGDFWPKLGFVSVPGAGGMLPKGWQKNPAEEGLRADIHFGLGVLAL